MVYVTNCQSDSSILSVVCLEYRLTSLAWENVMINTYGGVRSSSTTKSQKKVGIPSRHAIEPYRYEPEAAEVHHPVEMPGSAVGENLPEEENNMCINNTD